MRKAAEKELSILTQITKTDPENKKYCVHILDHAEFRNHVVFIFESLHLNLRETLKKFGKNTKIKKMKLELLSRPVFSLEFKTWTLVLVCTLVHTVLTGNSTSFLMQLFKSTMDMLQMLITYQK